MTTDGHYSWFRLSISMLISTIGGVGIWAYVVIMPFVQDEFGGGRGEASFAFTTTMLGFAVGNYFIGRFVDRYGAAVPVAIAGSLTALGFALGAYADSILELALIQGALIGLGTAAGFGPLIADVSHWFVRRRGLAVALVASGNYLAGALWSPLIEALIFENDWRFAFLVVAAAIVCTAVPLTFFLRKRPDLAETQDQTKHVNSAPRGNSERLGLSPKTIQVLLVAAGLGCCLAMSMPQVHIVAYCVDLGYGAVAGVTMLSIMLLTGVASRIASGFLMDRLGGVKTVLLGSSLQCLSLFLYIPFDGLVSLYVVSAVFGLAQGGIVPGYAIIIREYLPAKEAGARVGQVMMATVLGMALGGWMSGWLFDATGSYDIAFIHGIGWNLVNMLILTMLLLRTGRPTAARFA